MVSCTATSRGPAQPVVHRCHGSVCVSDNAISLVAAACRFTLYIDVYRTIYLVNVGYRVVYSSPVAAPAAAAAAPRRTKWRSSRAAASSSPPRVAWPNRCCPGRARRRPRPQAQQRPRPPAGRGARQHRPRTSRLRTPWGWTVTPRARGRRCASAAGLLAVGGPAGPMMMP